VVGPALPAAPELGVSTPAVSVVMPVWNPDRRYFPEAVRSVLEQSMDDLELVIVEDPSPVSARELIASVADPRVRLIENPARTTLVEQRNRAVREARSELIACMDADDISLPRRLEVQLEHLHGHPEIDVLGSAIEIIGSDGELLGVRRFPGHHDAIARAMTRYNPISTSSTVFRRSAAERAGGYRHDPFAAVEDYDLWCRMVRTGVRFENLPEVLVRYRVHPAAAKARRVRPLLRGTIAVKREHWRSEMGLVGRARILAESALVVLPSPVLFRAVVGSYYRGRRGRADLSDARR
jgi:glycosyltransferase involved in cell wall biosynthesis